MRKISELLEICKRHHELWGGPAIAMCLSAIEARHYGEMTIDEYYELEFHNMGLLEDIDPGAVYLFEALGLDRTQESDRIQLKEWWENHINSLKENGL